MSNEYREKSRAVFLAIVMLVSVVGASVAFTGAAAAAGNDSTVTQKSSGQEFVTPGAGNVAVQTLTVTAGNAGSTTISSFTVENTGTAGDSDVDQIAVYKEGGGQVGTSTGFGNVDASVEISTDTSQTFTVTADIASDPTDGNTIQTKTTVKSDSTYSGDGVATSGSATEIDAAPEITGATTADNDGNGQIDQLTIDFSEAVSVSDSDASNGIDGLNIDGYSIDGVESGDGSDSITFSLSESDSADTGTTPNVEYTQSGGLEDADQQSTEVTQYDPSAATDGAAPAAMNLQAGENNGDLTVTFDASETLGGSSGDLAATVTAPDDTQASLDRTDFSEDGTTYSLTSAVALDQTGTYTVDLASLSDGSNENTSLTDSATVSAGGASAVSITADPSGPGQSATHNVTWTLASGTDVQTYEVDYPSAGTDVSNVGSEDIVKFGVDEDGDGAVEQNFNSSDSNAGGVNEVNIGDGHVLSVTTSSSATIDQGETVILEYGDLQNPDASEDVALRLDPNTPDVDATRTLTIGSSSPSVDSISLNEKLVSGEPTFGQNVNGTDPSTVTVGFSKPMNTDVTPDLNVTIDGQQYAVNTSDSSTTGWNGGEDTYTAELEQIVSYDNVTVDGTITVSAAEDPNGNSISETSETFSIDTEPLGIESAQTVDSTTIAVTLNDTYTGAGTSDFVVTDDSDAEVNVGDLNTGYGENNQTELNLDSSLAPNATPTVTLVAGESIEDQNGNGAVEGTVNATDGIGPTLSGFDLTQKTGRILNVTFDSNEQLAAVDVVVTETGSDETDQTLNLTDLNETAQDDGSYTYATNFTVTTDGTFEASIAADVAEDDAGNTANAVSDAEGVAVDTTGPSIEPQSPHTDNAVVGSQGDITVAVSDDGNAVNPESIYVTLEDSQETLIDSGRVSAVDGLSYDSNAGELSIASDTFSYAKGDVTVTVEAEDTNGETGSNTWTFTYATVEDESLDVTEDDITVNVTTQTNFENVTATVDSTNSLANEDGVVSRTVDLTAEGDSYTGTVTGVRDGEYTLTDVTLENAQSKSVSEAPGTTATVNTTQPYLTDATISSYDGADTKITVQFNEPLADSTTINTGDTDTLSIEGEDVTSHTRDLTAGKVTLTVNNAVQTGDGPNVSINTASDITERHGDGNAKADSRTTIHTVQLSLTEGTNFVSVPAAAGTVDLGAYDANVDVVWTYEDGTWQSYDPEKSDANNDFTALEGGQGYVFEMNSGDTLDVNAYNVVGGDSRDTATPGQQDLSEGWNLVGHWQEGSQSQTNALSTLDNYDSSSRIYAQSGNGYTYTAHGGDFQPGESYWVFVTDDDVYGESTQFGS